MEHFIDKLERDRRLSRRHNYKTPLRLRLRKFGNTERSEESENLSQRGVFFNTSLQLTEGTVIDVLVEMPEEVTGVRPAHWLCTGHVVRIVNCNPPRGTRGVGVEFDFYEVSRSERPRWSIPVGLRGPVTS